MNPINQVAIIGGIHGNEFTGAYLIRKFSKVPDLVQRSTFKTLTLFGNPHAFAASQRYIDTDLNRCFTKGNLKDPNRTTYEDGLAKALYRKLQPADGEPIDFILDLHTSTANMGQTLVLSNHHPFNLKLVAYLSVLNPDVRVFSWKTHEEAPFIISLSDLGFVIEVGPITPGLLRSDRFQQTESLVHQVLDYLEEFNQSHHNPGPKTLTVYQYQGTVDYPRDEQGELQAMIHPNLQGQDYQPLHPGDPIFMTLTGETIPYQGKSTTWPIFINEASYYEKGIAFCLTQKQEICLDELE